MKVPTDHPLHWIAIGHIDITRRPRHQQMALVVAQDAVNTAWSPIPDNLSAFGVSPVVGLSQVQVSRIRSVNGAGYDGSTAREGRND